MKRIVIASDSFKGSLRSAEVAKAAALGIRELWPDCIVDEISIADGGEGMLESITECLKDLPSEPHYRIQAKKVKVSDPLGRKTEAEYIIRSNGNKRQAIIEMARASGLTLLSPEERNPLITNTYGTGELIMDALSEACSDFLIGIGGSATNDGGTGMLEALGFTFLNSSREAIKGCCGEKLKDIAVIDGSSAFPALKNAKFTIACDVNTPFCGPEGASFVFAAQKGASPEMIEELEQGMCHFADTIKRQYGISIADKAGSGAAGGIGGAFSVFLDAELKSGIDIILDSIGFDNIIMGADLVITGEGKIDGQSLAGKVPFGVLKRAQTYGIPVIAIAGIVDLSAESASAQTFKAILPIDKRPNSDAELQEAMSFEKASNNIRNTVLNYLKETF